MTAFLARAAESDVRMAELERHTAERFARMEERFEQRFARIEAILLEHSRILEALPDAVRGKLGFTPTPS
jgi:hypothetical protein